MSKKNMNMDAKAAKAKKQSAAAQFNQRSFKAALKATAKFENDALGVMAAVSEQNAKTYTAHLGRLHKVLVQYGNRIDEIDIDIVSPADAVKARKTLRSWVAEAYGLNTSDKVQNKRVSELNSWLKFLAGDGFADFEHMVDIGAFNFASHWAIGSLYNAVKAAAALWGKPKVEPQGTGSSKGEGEGEGEGVGNTKTFQVSAEVRAMMAAVLDATTDKELSQALRGFMQFVGVAQDRQGRVLAKV